MSFEEGDVLYITDQSNPSWWKARCGKVEGLVPCNYGVFVLEQILKYFCSICQKAVKTFFMLNLVEESMESLDNPLHDAAKRGNSSFMEECISNRVSIKARVFIVVKLK